MALPKVKRGEVWLLDLTPQSFKAEPGKRERPGLVIQTDILNEAGHATAVIIPGTTQTYRDEEGDGFPLRVPIGKVPKLGEQPQETDLLIDQIRAVSLERFMGGAPVTKLSRPQLKRVEEALKIVLGI
jgi:mRNA interferase MazF